MERRAVTIAGVVLFLAALAVWITRERFERASQAPRSSDPGFDAAVTEDGPPLREEPSGGGTEAGRQTHGARAGDGRGWRLASRRRPGDGSARTRMRISASS